MEKDFSEGTYKPSVTQSIIFARRSRCCAQVNNS